MSQEPDGDTGVAAPETDETNAPVETPDAETDQEAQVVEEEKPYLSIPDKDGTGIKKSFKTPEDAVRAYEEMEKYLSRKDQELNQLRQEKRLEKLEQQSEVALAAQQQRQLEEERKRLEEEFENDPKIALQILADMERAHAREMQSLRSEIRSEIESTSLKQSDDYRKNQAIVESLVERGMSLKDAVEAARDITGKIGPKQPPRPKPPVAGTSRPSGGEPKKRTLSPAERAAIQHMGFGEDFIAGIEKDMGDDQ